MSNNILDIIIKKKNDKIINLKKTTDPKFLNELISQTNNFINFK